MELVKKSLRLFLFLYAIIAILFFIRNCVLTGDYSQMVIVHFIIVSVFIFAPPIFIVSVLGTYLYGKIKGKNA